MKLFETDVVRNIHPCEVTCTAWSRRDLRDGLHQRPASTQLGGLGAAWRRFDQVEQGTLNKNGDFFPHHKTWLDIVLSAICPLIPITWQSHQLSNFDAKGARTQELEHDELKHETLNSNCSLPEVAEPGTK